MTLVRIPLVFYDDHQNRELDTPVAHKRNARNVWIDSEDPAVAELIDDARYYADPYGPDGGSGLRASAVATLKALGAK